MSRTYRIKLGLEEVTLHGNALLLPVTLSHILPGEDMKALLRDKLRSAGWGDGEQGYRIALRTDSSTSVLAELNEALDTLQIRLADRTVAITQERLTAEQRAKADRGEPFSPEELQAIAGPSDSEVAQAVASARGALNKVLAEVYKEAVLQKAQQLGVVESIQESESAHGTRLRITVNG